MGKAIGERAVGNRASEDSGAEVVAIIVNL